MEAAATVVVAAGEATAVVVEAAAVAGVMVRMLIQSKVLTVEYF